MSKFSKILIIIFGFLTFIFLLIFYLYYNFIANLTISYDKFEVKQGDTAYSVVNKICGNNYFKCFILKVYVKSKKYNSIKAGVYKFSSTNIDSFFKALEKGPSIFYKNFTILPSWTKYDIAIALGNKNGQKFLSLIDNRKYIEKLKERYSFLSEFGDISSLEGFIYPDTYRFKDSDFSSILFSNLLINTALKNFGKKWNKIFKSCKINKYCNPYNLSSYEILILASIVEKEEKNYKNKPYVADILIRRYKNNWFLGADWTLCYGLEINSKDCKKYLYNKYLKDKSNEYNTRAVKGLPPTPVGNPTIDSIKAVLYPIKNSYWYYLHDKNGQIHFGKTSNEHFINKQRYLK